MSPLTHRIVSPRTRTDKTQYHSAGITRATSVLMKDNMAKLKRWVVCSACGTLDSSRKRLFGTTVLPYASHVGTSDNMQCDDCCAPPSRKAGMCRNCCPSGHQTCCHEGAPLQLLIETGTVRRGKDCYEGLATAFGHDAGVWVQIGNDREDTEFYLESHPTPDTW